MYAINCITLWSHSWKSNGWKKQDGGEILHLPIIRECTLIIEEREERGFRTVLRHMKAHSSNKGNEAADELAKLGSKTALNKAMRNTMFFANGLFSQFFASSFTIIKEKHKLEFNYYK